MPTFSSPWLGLRPPPVDNDVSISVVRDEVSPVDACRSAYLGLLFGAQSGWGRRELVQWLVGTYQPLTVPSCHLPVIEPPALAGPITEAWVRQLLTETREQIARELLVLSTADDGGDYGFQALLDGLVEPIVDGDRKQLGWFPARGAGMGLAKRVRSLVAVDYILRPEDFHAKLVVCPRCDGIHFDHAVRWRSWCPGCRQGQHPRAA